VFGCNLQLHAAFTRLKPTGPKRLDAVLREYAVSLGSDRICLFDSSANINILLEPAPRVEGK
jgi:hypothetical protein